MPVESRWMIVCKPLRPPFNDGSTVLARDLVRALPSTLPLTYLGDPLRPVRAAAHDEVVDAPPMAHAPGVLDKIGVLRTLVDPRRRHQPLHFLFTPNQVTSSVLLAMRRLAPRRPMLQSLMSSHGATRWAAMLRPLDRVVVLSDYTRYRLVEAGLDGSRVVRIYPAVAAAQAVPHPSRRRRLLYAGDLDGQVVSRLAALARAMSAGEVADYALTVASRPKADGDAGHRRTLRRALAPLIDIGRAELFGEVPDMGQLMRRCSAQLFLADHVRRKVDLPLVALEGLMRGLPLLAMEVPPVSEIFALARRAGLEPGEELVDGRGHQPVVAAIKRWCVDDERLDRAGHAAQALARQQFALEKMGDAYCELYKQFA
ncbi:MAG: glycosyltransferase family 4 protein [Myxococcales bacterium FL481]|nr:MAG: glycosyltransferase family 4 protein [Myxococcales bacterium FL481]